MIGLLLALAAIYLAGRWATDITAPRPVAKLAAVAPPQADSGSNSLGRMFGVNEVQTQAVEGLRLTGVFAGTRGGGFATFTTPSGTVAAFPGQEVVPGIRLKQVERDRVILVTPESTREVRLSEDRAPAGAPPAQTTAAADKGTPAAQASPPDSAVPAADRDSRAKHSTQEAE